MAIEVGGSDRGRWLGNDARPRRIRAVEAGVAVVHSPGASRCRSLPRLALGARDDARLRLIDCGVAECGTSDVYERVQLPGALHLPTHGWLKQREPGIHVVGPEEFSRIMTSIGVSHDTTVVVYDDYTSSDAARLCTQRACGGS